MTETKACRFCGFMFTKTSRMSKAQWAATKYCCRSCKDTDSRTTGKPKIDERIILPPSLPMVSILRSDPAFAGRMKPVPMEG